jgi:hypothetical protein
MRVGTSMAEVCMVWGVFSEGRWDDKVVDMRRAACSLCVSSRLRPRRRCGRLRCTAVTCEDAGIEGADDAVDERVEEDWEVRLEEEVVLVLDDLGEEMRGC